MPERLRSAGYAMRRSDGFYLVKLYDKSYSRIFVGKWVLYSPDGTCVSHRRFFDQRTTTPPVEWADTKAADHGWLAGDRPT